MTDLTGIELIAKERQEQIEKHGFDVTNKKNRRYYSTGQLIDVACCVLRDQYTGHWWYPQNWGKWFLKSIEAKRKRMTEKEFKIETYKIAGALIAAEIDRLQNQSK